MLTVRCRNGHDKGVTLDLAMTQLASHGDKRGTILSCKPTHDPMESLHGGAGLPIVGVRNLGKISQKVHEHLATPKVTEHTQFYYNANMAWEYILFDLECNGFKPDKIWVISMVDLITREKQSFVGSDAIAEAIFRLQDAKMLVGHNIKTFDVRVIEKIMEGAVTFDRTRVVDTLYMSKALVKMDDHKLEGWGELLGVPKLATPFSFYRYDPRMVPYCERDVELNLEVFLALWAIMEQRHGDKIPPKWSKLLEYRAALPTQILTEQSPQTPASS